nr:MAG TPA: hypothetical protein [Caudoviricetes sp.]
MFKENNRLYYKYNVLCNQLYFDLYGGFFKVQSKGAIHVARYCNY